jgi:phosphate-selective porin
MKQVGAALVLGLASSTALAATPSMEEMWEIIQKQQAEIAELKGELAATNKEVQLTGEQVEATATAVEEGFSSGSSSLAGSWAERTHLGGYAEMHYNNLEDQNGDADKDEIDFHRFVLFLGHDFNEDTRFFSEVELEHSLSGDDKPGEVELEQAYIEHDLNATNRIKTGLFLLPLGLLNETHEPDTFFGVERNSVEKNIIPTTWWEGGVSASGEIMPGLNYDAAFTSGLKLDMDQYKIRDGRQKVAEADASSPAYTAGLSYTGIAGLEIGAALNYQEDLYQGAMSDDIDALLATAHVAYENGPFGLRALVASWDIDSAIENVAEGADTQEGWYIEPSYMITRDLGVFARYSEWDNQAGSGNDTQYNQWDIGLNYWLVDTVAFKLDYQFQEAPDGGKELEGFNLGVGWSFQ